jgi:hypothetical protein
MQKAAHASSDLVATANEANENAKAALEAQVRPWLSPIGETVEQVASSAVTYNGQPYLTIKFDLKFRNYGQSPAMFAWPRFQLVGGPAGKQDAIRRDGDTMCDEAVREITHMNQNLDVIFPGTDGIVSRTINAGSPTDAGHFVLPRSEMPVYLAGCIAYQGAGKIIYRTAAYYRVILSKEIKRSSRDGTEYSPVDHLERWWVEPRENWSPRK